MRKLASIQTISDLSPIEGKDRIELASVLGWHVVVQKGIYQVGDLCVYCEPDSVMPAKEEFDFLQSKKYRIRVMKMSGVLSEGICFPLSILPSGTKIKEGEDVTAAIGVAQWEPDSESADQDNPKFLTPDTNFLRNLMSFPPTRPIGRLIMRHNVKARKEAERFPRFIHKTDENRIQTLPWIFNGEGTYVCREKIDGSSMTAYIVKRSSILPWKNNKYEFGVCSRNRRLSKGSLDAHKFLSTAEKLNLKDALINIAHYAGGQALVVLQGELIGPGIQKNKYGLSDYDFYAFNLITEMGSMPCTIAEKIVKAQGVKWCPLVGVLDTPMAVEDILKYATEKSQINPNILRKGIVCRNYAKGISFKAVSPDFLIKNDL